MFRCFGTESSFFAVEKIEIKPTCRLRRIFTTRHPLVSSTGSRVANTGPPENFARLPSDCVFKECVQSETCVVTYESICAWDDSRDPVPKKTSMTAQGLFAQRRGHALLVNASVSPPQLSIATRHSSSAGDVATSGSLGTQNNSSSSVRVSRSVAARPRRRTINEGDDNIEKSQYIFTAQPRTPGSKRSLNSRTGKQANSNSSNSVKLTVLACTKKNLSDQSTVKPATANPRTPMVAKHADNGVEVMAKKKTVLGTAQSAQEQNAPEMVSTHSHSFTGLQQDEESKFTIVGFTPAEGSFLEGDSWRFNIDDSSADEAESDNEANSATLPRGPPIFSTKEKSGSGTTPEFLELYDTDAVDELRESRNGTRLLSPPIRGMQDHFNDTFSEIPSTSDGMKLPPPPFKLERNEASPDVCPVSDESEDELELQYDHELNCFYDPLTHKYYELL